MDKTNVFTIAPTKKSKKTNNKKRDVEQDCKKDIEDFKTEESAFKKAAKREDNRFFRTTDTEYWFAVYFRGRDEKENFLKQYGLSVDTKYISGDKFNDRIAKK